MPEGPAGARQDGASKNLFISGSVGVGKTTLVREAILPYRGRAGGFYTEEILQDGLRLGFRIVTLDGRQAVLASKALFSATRVNKYGVDLAAVEAVAVPALASAREASPLVVIDEIGPMELLSAAFRREVSACLDSPKPVLATLRLSSHAFADSIGRLEAARVLELRRPDYERVKGELRAWLWMHLGQP